MNPGSGRKKIVILGGGISALTTAFQLTSQPGWQDRYEVDVYQLGWRLGGKAASGRNLERHQRIEEGGIHIFFGYYVNAFRMLETCYKEIGRPRFDPVSACYSYAGGQGSTTLLGTPGVGMKPHSYGVLEQPFKNGWESWPLNNPRNLVAPGEGGVLLPVSQYVLMALQALRDFFTGALWPFKPKARLEDLEGYRDWARKVLQGAPDAPPEDSPIEVLLMHVAYRLALLSSAEVEAAIHNLPQDEEELAVVPREAESQLQLDHGTLRIALILIKVLLDFIWKMYKSDFLNEPRMMWSWITTNFLFANIRGTVFDDVLKHGFNHINHHDYRDWLERWAVKDDWLTARSAWAQVPYAMLFAYERGEISRPNMEAGTALRTQFRLFLTNKDAALWPMQAGTGDVVFAPIYQVLRQRGVRFHFFSRVEKLRIGRGSEGKIIEHIDIQVQATLEPPRQEYEPLVEVKGIPCWPSEPLYGQLVQGRQLKEEGIDLESWWTPWKGVGTLRLTAGRDFDQVVLGIPIASLPCICSELVDDEPRWRAMVDNVRTVRTAGLQLWIKKPFETATGNYPARPVLSCYDYDPSASLNTWLDRSEALATENWPALGHLYPRSLAYFCGATLDDFPGQPCKEPLTPEDVRKLQQRVRAMAVDLLKKNIAPIWPMATLPPGQPGAPFDWDLLVDDRPSPGKGEERLDAQYWINKINPSDRYVQSVVDSSRYRLR
ncbi:MAG TPA: NAD(P)-binding protein, partial [Thermoanaerobaculia bacterium]